MTTALLLVDIQNDYFADGKMELVGLEAVSNNISEVLLAFRRSSQPVVHIHHIEYDPRASCLIAGTPGAEAHGVAKPQPGETIIYKRFANSFIHSGLLCHLWMIRAHRVFICGAMSHTCISATGRGASEMGFESVVVHDACATRAVTFGGRSINAENVQGVVMAALAASNVKVVSTADAVSLVSELPGGVGGVRLYSKAFGEPM